MLTKSKAQNMNPGSLKRKAQNSKCSIKHRPSFHGFLARQDTSCFGCKSDCGTFATYNVQKYASTAKYRTVEYHKEENVFKCSCKHFEEYGMICVHMIAVFKLENIQKIPESCILKRWTKVAGSELSVPNPHPTTTMKEINLRYAALSSICNHLCNAAAQDSDVFSTTRGKLMQLCSEVEYSRANGKTGSEENWTQQAVGVLDPEIVRAKGCRGERGKDGRKSKATPRLCSGCREAGHKVTTCPRRRKESNQPSPSQPETSSHSEQPVQPAYYSMQAPYYYPVMQAPMHGAYYQPPVGQSSVQLPFTSNQYWTADINSSQAVRDALKFGN